jgi:hypothetical protein
MFGPGVSTIPSATNAKANTLVSDGMGGSPSRTYRRRTAIAEEAAPISVNQ